MPNTITLNSIERNDVFLQPNERFTIEFSPVAGEVVAAAIRTPPGVTFRVVNPNPYVGHVSADTVLGPIGPVGLPPVVTLGGIRIEIFPPGATGPLHTLDTEDFATSSDRFVNEPPKNRLRFEVPENLAGPGWKCRFTNISQEDSQCRANLQFPDHEVTLSETRISRRLLNRTFRQLFIALGLQVLANSGIGLVSVRDEIEHLTDGALKDMEFTIPRPLFTEVSARMDRLSATADRDGQTGLPKVVFEAGFDLDIDVGKLEIFGVEVVTLMALRRLDIKLNIALRPSERPAIPNVIVPDVQGNVIIPDISADVELQGALNPTVSIPVKVNQFCSFQFDLSQSFNLGQLEELIKCALVEFVWSDVEVRTAISRHLTEGIMALAERDHVFWEIAADGDAYIVRHFRAPTSRPSLGLQDTLHSVDDVFDTGTGSDSSSDSGITPSTDTITDANVSTTVDAGSSTSTPSASSVNAATASGSYSAATPPEAALASSLADSTLPAGGEPDPALVNLDKIENIVVLMMENRSFDHMLGYLQVRGGQADIDGLTGNETNLNPITGNLVTARPLSNTLFPFSPHHEHDHVLAQVNDGAMDGFLADFMDRFGDVDPRFGMGYYTEEKLPVYDFLAQNFAVCDRWFCSHPGPTMPNRFCTLMGAMPELDNLSTDDPRVGYLRQTNIFDWLTANRVSWAYYEQDISFLRVFDRYRLDDRNILPFSAKDDVNDEYSDNEIFFSRLANGNLPSVTFVDPNFVDVPPEITANDDHPPADVACGQELIRQIYNALVQSPQWEKTLFVITYDEHGGFFDHVPPPGTKASPEGENIIPKVHEDGPEFYGVRVPALVISPWVDAGGNSTTFDHTSIIKTILAKFSPPSQDLIATDDTVVVDFGERVRQANHLGSLLSRDTPRLDVATIESIIFPEASFFTDRQPASEPASADFHDVMQRLSIPKR